MKNVSLVLFARMLAIFILAGAYTMPSSAANSAANQITNIDFDNMLNAFRADPNYLKKNQDFIKHAMKDQMKNLSEQQQASIVDEVLKAYRSDPAFLAENQSLIPMLKQDQLAMIIEKLGFNHFEYLHPVVIKGNEVSQLLGHANNDVVVMSVRGGKLKAIPTQVDDVDLKGWSFDPKNSLFKIDGTEGKLDGNDEIIFMYRDTGVERFSPERMALAKGKMVKELEFTGSNNKKRYAYIVIGGVEKSSVDYVSFDKKTGKTNTTFFEMEVNPDNVLENRGFKAHVGDRPDHRVLDQLMFQINTGVLTRWTKVNLNSYENIFARIKTVVDGPVRAGVLLQIKVQYAGVPIMTIFTQMTIYDQSIKLPINIEMPGSDVLSKFLVRPKMEFYLDFNDQVGAKMNSSHSSDPINGYGIVDGEIDSFEKSADINARNNWVWLSSNHGWDFYSSMKGPDSWEAEIELFYEDDFTDKNKFETFRGAAPRIGYDIVRLDGSMLNMRVNVDLMFPDTVGAEGPATFDQWVNNPPEMIVNNMKVCCPKCGHCSN